MWFKNPKNQNHRLSLTEHSKKVSIQAFPFGRPVLFALMMRWFLLTLCCICAFSLGAQDTSKARLLCFKERVFEMDTLEEGVISEAVFHFEVCDRMPVLIHQVWPGCGCTVADYPKDTLFPGKSYTLSLRYFSEGRPGFFLRTAHVLFHSTNPLDDNPNAETQLSITGFVHPRIETPVIVPEQAKETLPRRRQRKKSR
ncbi:MAG: hypothetical protein RLZZ370_428 [Bacteroidota bacterium]|jgi:hypothetical protein